MTNELLVSCKLLKVIRLLLNFSWHNIPTDPKSEQ